MKRKVHDVFPVAVSVPALGGRIPKASSIRPARLDEGKVVTGHTTRDFHTREYVPGDDLRHVHWPSTAKFGELMVRHEADEETLYALIVIDLVADEGDEEPTDLEVEFLLAAATAAERPSSGPTMRSSSSRTATRSDSKEHAISTSCVFSPLPSGRAGPNCRRTTIPTTSSSAPSAISAVRSWPRTSPAASPSRCAR